MSFFFTMPLFISLLAVPVLGERLDPLRGFAVLLGLAGVVIALDPRATPLGLGHALALTGSLVGAMNYVIIRKTGAVERTAVMLIWPQVALFLAVAATMPFVYRPMPLEDLGALAVMAVLGLIGNLLAIYAYRIAEAGVVAPMQYSQILWATAYGLLFFEEVPDVFTAIGAAVIIASGLYILSREGRARASETRPVSGSQVRAGIGTVPKTGHGDSDRGRPGKP